MVGCECHNDSLDPDLQIDMTMVPPFHYKMKWRLSGGATARQLGILCAGHA